MVDEKNRKKAIVYKSGEEVAKELFPELNKGPAPEYARIRHKPDKDKEPDEEEPDEEPKDEEEKTDREEYGQRKRPLHPIEEEEEE